MIICTFGEITAMKNEDCLYSTLLTLSFLSLCFINLNLSSTALPLQLKLGVSCLVLKVIIKQGTIHFPLIEALAS